MNLSTPVVFVSPHIRPLPSLCQFETRVRHSENRRETRDPTCSRDLIILLLGYYYRQPAPKVSTVRLVCKIDKWLVYRSLGHYNLFFFASLKTRNEDVTTIPSFCARVQHVGVPCRCIRWPNNIR